MLSAENFTIDHIRKLRDKYHKDVALIERTVYAFGLLEALVTSGLKFIFKGGTSLLLLLDSPMRLSTDIDIIVTPDTQIEEYMEKEKTSFPSSAPRNQSEHRKQQYVNVISSSITHHQSTMTSHCTSCWMSYMGKTSIGKPSGRKSRMISSSQRVKTLQ